MVLIAEWFIAASLPRGTLITFKATWCDFNLNVNLMCFSFILPWCALSREMLQAQIWTVSCFSVLVSVFVWHIFLSKAVALWWCLSWVQGYIWYKGALGTSTAVIPHGDKLVLGCSASQGQKSSHWQGYCQSYNSTGEGWKVACSLYKKRFHNSPCSTSYEMGFKTWTCEKEEKYWNVLS